MPRVRPTTQLVIDSGGLPSALRQPVFTLQVVRGPSRRLKKTLRQRRVLIGSSDGADLALADETVSAVHCEVWVDEQGFHVRDHDSRNGVFLGDKRVQEAWLNPGDAVTLGKSVVRLEVASETADAALHPADRLGG